MDRELRYGARGPGTPRGVPSSPAMQWDGKRPEVSIVSRHIASI